MDLCSCFTGPLTELAKELKEEAENKQLLKKKKEAKKELAEKARGETMPVKD